MPFSLDSIQCIHISGVEKMFSFRWSVKSKLLPFFEKIDEFSIIQKSAYIYFSLSVFAYFSKCKLYIRNGFLQQKIFISVRNTVSMVAYIRLSELLVRSLKNRTRKCDPWIRTKVARVSS